MTIADTIQDLRDEVDRILRRYNVPLEERSYILERVGGAVGTVSSIQEGMFNEKIEDLRRQVSSERENVRRDVDNIKKLAITKIVEANQKVDEAYERGLSQAQEESKSKSGPGALGVILGIFFAALAFVVVASGLFKGKER